MIRTARMDDLPRLLEVFATAQRYMVATGNPHQWPVGHPSSDVLTADISAGHLYVEETDGVVHAAFAFIVGEDPTYGYIEDGAWLSDTPYGTIHRLASDGANPGFFGRCVAFCHSRMSHLRVDTHHDNAVMQHLAESHGFTRCGIIYLANGSPRIAYERID